MYEKNEKKKAKKLIFQTTHNQRIQKTKKQTAKRKLTKQKLLKI